MAPPKQMAPDEVLKEYKQLHDKCNGVTTTSHIVWRVSDVSMQFKEAPTEAETPPAAAAAAAGQAGQAPQRQQRPKRSNRASSSSQSVSSSRYGGIEQLIREQAENGMVPACNKLKLPCSKHIAVSNAPQGFDSHSTKSNNGTGCETCWCWCCQRCADAASTLVVLC